MAIIKCKMCGGELMLLEGQSVAECEFCGSRQTVPTGDSEKKLQQFERADWLRRSCEFDKAAAVYETIVSEFRQEAEAYWGLVLCKYGIEYVDDPATGKKIPTCHRSSFDSVLDDANLEQALDYADATARKVYREEAKTIEEIRKGILAVSGNEQPYDIFICYKETDPNGDRTLDSVLAQELYTSLTDRGYRVFFSRITLQSKLGEAYEPYIFAALNSAKVMLAVGTNPEYYNAVWVKNEWSRYLKLCAADKSKHLIPCYKDLDAYDMPKEFRPLQGVDLGKMGAVQDILFNMEKYIPLNKQNTNVVQERVVVGGSGDNKIASLLDRGNMALEDGDWAKADSFFEDVLNNDSKNAQAYLGKTLAMEKCRTIDAFARKRKDTSQNVRGEALRLEADRAHVEEKVQQFSLPGFVEQEQIRRLYGFDLSYHSDVAERKQQYRNEENYWANHKQLSRAEKFAVGAVAESLAREKKALFAALADRVRKAEAAEATAKNELQARYEAHLRQMDEEAEKRYEAGLSLREQDYQQLLQTAKTSGDVEELENTARRFEALGAYQDSKNLAEHCRKRAAEEQQKLDEEAERKRLIKEKEKKARQARLRRIGIAAAVAAVVVFAAVLVVTQVIIPTGQYNEAVALLEQGQYEEAITAFEALNGFKDSQEKITEARNRIAYEAAEALLSAGDRAGAVAAFGELGSYRDAAQRITAILAEAYAEGEAFLTSGDKVHAAMAFGFAANYSNARQRSMELWKNIVTPSNISLSLLATVALKSDGTVIAVGDNKYDQLDITDWKNVISVAAGFSHTYGLLADGTVLVAGKESEVLEWKDIVAISSDGAVVGLKIDGTVVTAERPVKGTEDWSDIIAVSSGDSAVVGLKADGTVVIAPVSESRVYTIPADGTWTNIVAVDAGDSHTVALRADGTVLAVGSNNNEGQCDVSAWRDIIAVSAGSQHTVGLKSDGTVVAIGHNDYGQCEVSEWTEIVTVVAGPYYTVGLKADGTVVAAGSDRNGKTAVEGLKDIMLPEKLVADLADQKAKTYAQAEALLANQQFDEAIRIFESLGGYEDAAQRVTEVLYAKGVHLLSVKSYQEAAEVFAQLGTYQESAAKLQEAKWGLVKTARVGDVLRFGSFEQDGNSANGKEEIEWTVMDRDGNDLVLFSKYILENMAFDENKSNVWNNSSVKVWLNESFFAEAFSDAEQARIQQEEAGKVYLLSEDELRKYYGDITSGVVGIKLQAKTTAAAGRYHMPENWWWWTRTSDGYHNAANCVKSVSQYGGVGRDNASAPGGGVRPAITIRVDE